MSPLHRSTLQRDRALSRRRRLSMLVAAAAAGATALLSGVAAASTPGRASAQGGEPSGASTDAQPPAATPLTADGLQPPAQAPVAGNDGQPPAAVSGGS